MKSENRNKLYRALDKQANPDRIEKVLTTTEFARMRENGNGKTAS